MMINRNNYEAFFLDFIEGRLNEEQRAEVQLFLLKHPDLAAELEDLTALPLAENLISPAERLSLYQSLTPGEDPIYPPFAFKKPDRPAQPIFLPKLQAPAILYVGKHALYHQLNAASWNLLPGWTTRLYKPLDKSKLMALKADGVLPRLVAPAIVFENKSALYKAVTPVVPLAPAAQGAKIIGMRRSLYYGAAAAAIAAIIWMGAFDNPNTIVADRAKTNTEQEREVNSTPEKTSAPDATPIQEDSAAQNAPKNPSTRRDSSPQTKPVSNEDFTPDVAVQTPSSPSQKVQNEDQQAPQQMNIISPNTPSHEEAVAQETNTAQEFIPVVNINEEKNALAITASANNRSYSNLWEFAKDRAKSKIWGNENYPKEDYAFSLVKKELDKSDDIEIEGSPKKEKGKFHLRIGKFSITKH